MEIIVNFVRELFQNLLETSIDPPILALMLVGVGLLLVSLARGIVTLLLRRMAPNWVEWVSAVVQLGLLAGQMLLIADWVAPNSDLLWQTILGLTLIAAAIVPGNPISDGVGFVRIRGLGYFSVGDWVTLANEQTGRVTAIYPFSTMVRTRERGRVRISNSKVVAAPIVLHRSQAATENALAAGSANRPFPKKFPTGVLRHGEAPSSPLRKRPPMGSQSTKWFSR